MRHEGKVKRRRGWKEARICPKRREGKEEKEKTRGGGEEMRMDRDDGGLRRKTRRGRMDGTWKGNEKA